MPGREPIVLAMVVCDAVHVDPQTHKWFLLGAFSGIPARTFPHVAPRLAVYVCLTEYTAHAPFTLRVVDADDERPPVIDVSVAFPVADPLGVAQMDVTLDRLTFPAAGVYAFQLLWEGRLLVERRVRVRNLLTA